MLVERILPSILCIGEQIFYPGVNNIIPELIDHITGHQLFKEQCSLGHLKIIKAATGAAPVDPDVLHDELAREIMSIKDVKKAAEVVTKTLSIGTLKLIAKSETRKSVQKAAQVRLDEMLATPETEKKME